MNLSSAPSVPRLPTTFWSGASRWKEALSLVEPVCHLTLENFHEIIDFAYVVGPKADGERALLISDWLSNDVYLLSMSGTLTRIEGAKTNDIMRGFILDVEVVNGPGKRPLVLAFDVLALHPKAMPQSPPAKAENQVQSLLNRTSRHNFEKLSNQLCNIAIVSNDMMVLISKLVYENAISSPAFSDLFAKLCERLQIKERELVHIVESDEATLDGKGGKVSYRWTNAASTSDAKIVGPFGNQRQCIDAALPNEETESVNRGDTQLTLLRLLIKNGIFIKIMRSQTSGKFYIVFFPVSKADERGQHLSHEIFTSQRKARYHAEKKTNSFMRSIHNKCEDEFMKQDVYAEWNTEKEQYEKDKPNLSKREQNKREEELEVRRGGIKKRTLANIKFSEYLILAPIIAFSQRALHPPSDIPFTLTRSKVGELYKLKLLKGKILRFCIQSLLKLEEYEGGLRSKTNEAMNLNEDNHEAIFVLLTTAGESFDRRKDGRPFMRVYFDKINTLNKGITLSSRIRFMYEDLIEMRSKYWRLKYETETAKTLDYIFGRSIGANGSFYASSYYSNRETSTPLKRKMSYLMRRELLSKFVDSVAMAGLLLKPVADAVDAPLVWTNAQKLPYPVDGLVFTPCCHGYTYIRYKWKPPQKLTLDVALGNEIVQEDERSLFRAHLSISASDQSYHSRFMDFSNAAPQGHAPFRYKSEETPSKHPFEKAQNSNDQRDSDVHCYCVVADHTGLVWVPHPDRDRATFRIVEVSFDSRNGQLQFERSRHDKRVANSIRVANEISSAKANPIHLDEVALLLRHTNQSSTTGENKYLDSYRTGTHCEGSSFSSLRCMHSHIKKWLYEAFGGDRIVDACSGGIHDLNNWIASGVQHVLALEQDIKLIQEGKERISRSSSESSIEVALIDVNLTQPLGLGTGLEFKHQSSAVFCHFGLHYFWQSQNLTDQFLSNLVQFLSDGGFFVATVLRSDIFSSTPHVCILNDDGMTEFEANKIDDDTADVFISTIGKVHQVSIIEEEEAKQRFAKNGLDHIATYPFSSLANLYPSIQATMSQHEVKMSHLYTAYVFVKTPDSDIEQVQPPLFGFPAEVERQIMLYLDVDELVSKVRGISRAARRCVDTLDIPDTSRWFRNREAKISFRSLTYNRRWSSASVGLFLRLGGVIDDTVEDARSSYDQSRDYSDHDSNYFNDYSDYGIEYDSDYW